MPKINLIRHNTIIEFVEPEIIEVILQQKQTKSIKFFLLILSTRIPINILATDYEMLSAGPDSKA